MLPQKSGLGFAPSVAFLGVEREKQCQHTEVLTLKPVSDCLRTQILRRLDLELGTMLLRELFESSVNATISIPVNILKISINGR